MRNCSRVFVIVFVFMILAAFWPLQEAAAAGSAYYIVVAEVLPIMDSPGAKYVLTYGEVEDSEAVEGVVVYGNRLELRPSKTKGWSELLSPEDGSLLGYVETKGVEKFPDYRETETRYYMALKDAPELLLRPGKKDKKNNLS